MGLGDVTGTRVGGLPGPPQRWPAWGRGSMGNLEKAVVPRGLVILKLMTAGFFSLHMVRFTFCASYVCAVFPKSSSKQGLEMT